MKYRTLLLASLLSLLVVSSESLPMVRAAEENAKEPGPSDKDAPKEFTTTKSGLKYRILRKSSEAKPTENDVVKVNYKGWLDNGKEFDSSYERGESIEFPLSGVIPGWTEGMQYVGEGGMIELEIPYQLGYGVRGAPPDIPGKSTLHFIIELLEIVAPPEPGKADDDAPTEFTTTESGLKYRVLRKSDDVKPTAKDTVQVNYKGWLDDGKAFDTSYKIGGRPAEFPLGNVIAGWTEGLQHVGKGGMIELEVPSELGYGAKGSPPRIPEDATLHFIVELLEVKSPPEPGKADDDAPTEFTTTKSGLKYRVLRKSDDLKPTAKDTVQVHYKGWLDNGNEFDTSYKVDGDPIEFPLSGVIAGWTEGLQHVGKGGMIELEIPHELGYGVDGSPPQIPGKSTLHFIVELLEVTPPLEPGEVDKDAPDEFTTTKSGLKYRIRRKSDGPKPTAADSVQVHYKGWLDGGKVFDSSYDRGAPISFPLANVIKGWTEGMQLIGEGGMIELEVPYELAYGERGRPPVIPAKARLHFLVELLEVQ